MLGPLALCRLDAALIARVRAGDRLAPLMLEAAAWMLAGAAVYGCVFGLWRAPLQAVYAGAKLPLLLLALVLSTAAANALFARLVGTGLTAAQSLCCSLLGMALLGIALASLAPVSLLFAWSVESYGERLVGVHGDEARAALRGAQGLLAYHVALIGLVGVACLRKLRQLLGALVGSASAATRVFWLWLAVQALVGTQLSWILRPYLGKPALPVELLRPDAFHGSFFEEVARWLCG